MADVKKNNREGAESSVPTDMPDLGDLPLSRVASCVDAEVLRRVVPEPLERRVATAAFNSSI
ncbi:FxSxx-COOH cyclophane-containing RiPP peptide [Streptosporangium sp. NPDC006930]|uniref:FxSxx-COOH cyclophane-containing RiPP peptide n=1 Tax=unclassified Streptosporangium TaxID=2632669 RepID=UPI003428BA18